jgi:hypothetical protein
MASRMASGLAAAAVAAILSTAPARAMMLPGPQVRCPRAGSLAEHQRQAHGEGA